MVNEQGGDLRLRDPFTHDRSGMAVGRPGFDERVLIVKTHDDETQIRHGNIRAGTGAHHHARLPGRSFHPGRPACLRALFMRECHGRRAQQRRHGFDTGLVGHHDKHGAVSRDDLGGGPQGGMHPPQPGPLPRWHRERRPRSGHLPIRLHPRAQGGEEIRFAVGYGRGEVGEGGGRRGVRP